MREEERIILVRQKAIVLWSVFLMLLMYAAAAEAAFEAGGSVAVDFHHYMQEKAGFGGNGSVARTGGTPTTGGYAGINDDWPTEEEDRSATFIDFSKTSTLWFRWMIPGAGLYVMPVLAGDASQATGINSLKVAFVSAFGWYQMTPALTFSVGKGLIDIFSPLDPGTYVGYDAIGKVTGLGYGNINSKYQNGAKFVYTINPHCKVNFGIYESRIVDPNNSEYTSNGPYIGFAKSSASAVVDNVTALPKFEISVPVSYGSTKIIPSGMYLQQKFDNIAAGADDTITTYGLSLAMETRLKIFEFKGEFNYGQNWFNSATKINVCTSYPFKSEYVSSLGWAQSAAGNFLAPDGKLYDSENMAFWLQTGLVLGRYKPRAIFGYQTAKRDIPTQETDIKTMMYGVTCPIQVTDFLTLAPEFMIYDNGEENEFLHIGRLQSTGYSESDVYDCGKEYTAGLQVRWTF